MSKGNGEELFPFDDDNNSENAEGPVHCHGFAWANDPYDFTSRYKGNNLFFVSMYDHMNQRGYVRAVPGAPMCGCTEQVRTSDLEIYLIFYKRGTSFLKTTLSDVFFSWCSADASRFSIGLYSD
jgi:hypothetical protein